jgi:hypothetical protein
MAKTFKMPRPLADTSIASPLKTGPTPAAVPDKITSPLDNSK